MSDLLELANRANEAAAAWRAAIETPDFAADRWAARHMVAALDELTGAVVEAENNRPTAVDPFDPLIELFSRRREVLAYAARRDIVFGQAVIELVNEALSHGLDRGLGLLPEDVARAALGAIQFRLTVEPYSEAREALDDYKARDFLRGYLGIEL